jgi:hypothetical protein
LAKAKSKAKAKAKSKAKARAKSHHGGAEARRKERDQRTGRSGDRKDKNQGNQIWKRGTVMIGGEGRKGPLQRMVRRKEWLLR